MIITPLFSTLIHYIEIPDFDKDALIKYVYEQRDNDPSGMQRSNAGGWQSNDEYNQSDNIIDKTLKSFLSTMLHNKAFVEGIGFNIINTWININGKGHSNLMHCHPLSDYSGVIWIKVPKDSGHLVFSHPNSFEMAKQIVTYSEDLKKSFNVYPEYRYTPVEGGGVIFPSSVYHTVSENMSDEDRISVSFNLY